VPSSEPTAEFVSLTLPDSKEDIEAYVVAGLMRSCQGTERFLEDLDGQPTQNAQSDHDFTLKKPTGNERLELVEIAPAQTAGPPGSTPAPANNGAYADMVRDIILTKTKKYGLVKAAGQAKVHLLLYSTDWKLRVPVAVKEILMAELAHIEHGFVSILIYEQDDDDQGEVMQLAPVSSDVLATISVAQLRDRQTVQFDLTKFTVHDDGSVSVPISLPPDFKSPK
jgi:hypothetical protein